jgi:hypothetical protein
MKNLKIKQTVFGQEVEFEISLDEDNFKQPFSAHAVLFSEDAFNYIRTNFYNIISRVANLRYSKSSDGIFYCYADNSQPQQFPFIYNEILYCFHFGINKEGRIIIHYEEYKTHNLKVAFDKFLEQLDNYSDLNYYSYYAQKLEITRKEK